jgi:outer membrane protein TolC
LLILISGTLATNVAPSFAAPAFTQEIGTSQVLTVDEAVRTALNNNLSLKRNAIDLGTRKRTADRSWNSLLPTVSASAMVSHPMSVTGPVEPESRDVWTPGFSINAGLTLSASVIENIKKAQADYEAGLLTYETARQELELSVRKLFYQILLLDANRELAVQNFTSAQARYEQSATLARVGQAPRLDELSARVDMENQRPSVRNAEMLYENALDSFKAILGIPAETLIRLEGQNGEWEIGGVPTGNESLEAARLLITIRSMEAQRNAVRNSAYIPNLRLSWSSTPLYNLQNENWNDNGSFSISLGFNIDNFLPWSGAKTQIDTLNDNIRATEIQLAETLRNRENRVSQNMRTLDRILESLEATKLNVELAQSTYTQYEDAYRRGAADYQRLRSAGDSLEQAKNRLLQEQYNLVSALLDLEKELNIPFGSLTNEQRAMRKEQS